MYDPLGELQRMVRAIFNNLAQLLTLFLYQGVGNEGVPWRVCGLNKKYEMCDTYPGLVWNILQLAVFGILNGVCFFPFGVVCSPCGMFR